MTSRRISIHEAPAWVSALGKEMHAAAVKGLYAAALRTVAHIQTSLIPAEPVPPVDRGAYRAAWVAKKLPNGALVANTLPYAAIIEDGARAENIKIGRTMIAALTAWVIRKGIGADRSGGRGAGGRFKAKSVTAEKAEQIAWAIAISMKKRGIFNRGQGLHILQKAERMIPRFIQEEIARELRRL